MALFVYKQNPGSSKVGFAKQPNIVTKLNIAIKASILAATRVLLKTSPVRTGNLRASPL